MSQAGDGPDPKRPYPKPCTAKHWWRNVQRTRARMSWPRYSAFGSRYREPRAMSAAAVTCLSRPRPDGSKRAVLPMPRLSSTSARSWTGTGGDAYRAVRSFKQRFETWSRQHHAAPYSLEAPDVPAVRL